MNRVVEHNPGGAVPMILNELPLTEARKRQDALTTWYRVRATRTSPIDASFTGVAMGTAVFVNGVAKVRTLYEARLLYMRGCIDDTPQWMIDLHKARQLNKILVIRNAAFGDVEIITPAIIALRQKYPNATLHFYGREDTRDVIKMAPFIDGIVDCRTTEVGALLGAYDEIFDLVHSIECNPTADYESARKLCADYLGVENPTDTKNAFYLTPQELSQAGQFLAKCGVRNVDKLIIFQYEGTALARSLTPVTTLLAAHRLAEAGYEVLLWSHKNDFLRYRLMRNKSGHHCTTPDAGGPSPIMIKNQKGIEEEYTEVPRHPRILHCHPADQGVPRRILFGAMHYCQHVIAVDSFFSHLADALNKTCTIIFTNYHPYTRTENYDLADVIHVPPEKLPCGPCNGLLNDCPLTPKGIPLCSSKITPEQITEAVLQRLEVGNPLFQEYRDTPSTHALHDHFHKPKTEVCCKTCGSKDMRLATVKRGVRTYECGECLSLSTIEEAPAHTKKALGYERYRPVRNEPAEKIGTLLQKALPQAILRDQKPVYDLVSVPDTERLGKPSALNQCGITQIGEEAAINTTLCKDGVVLWIDGWLEKEPAEAMKSIGRLLEKNEAVALVYSHAELWDRSNHWKYLLQPVAGIVRWVPSLQGLRKRPELRQYDQNLFVNTDGNFSMIVLKKKGE